MSTTAYNSMPPPPTPGSLSSRSTSRPTRQGICPPQTQRGNWPRQYHTVGSGTLDDPHVIWAIPPHTVHDIYDAEYERRLGHPIPNHETLKKARIHRINMVCMDEAIEQGYRCVVVRSPCHATSTVRDERTLKITDHESGDERLTVFMGDSWSSLHIQGHIFVRMGREGLPAEKIRCESDRRIVEPGSPGLVGRGRSYGDAEMHWCRSRSRSRSRAYFEEGRGTDTRVKLLVVASGVGVYKVQ
ncbi:hypothetical protein B0T19DRAFT_399963 [Cercophora scortea]|uniref:Uncharacterized protein n=1 Tax=Cercophora scortea TaxID=314031 RepID=A0AAE0IL51_9PEZI|nr:hypothetical protein B0T19DRAFT_399963 [Cercophora scortea]